MIIGFFYLKRRDSSYLASHLAKKLEDPDSIEYYRLLVNKIGSREILSALDATMAFNRKNKIFNKGAYFLGILRKRGFPVKFR